MIRSLAVAVLLATHVAHAAKIPCKLKLPMVHDGCQGDWCAAVSHLEFTQDTDLVKDLQSKVVIQKISKGTKIKKPFGFEIEIKRSGIYKVIDKTIEIEDSKYILKRGTAFEVLYHSGQGHYAICVENDILKFELGDNVEELAAVKAEDWIKIKLNTKTSGYVKRSEVKVIDKE